MANFDDLRGVLDPRTEVRAGAFRSCVFDMLHDGWRFERGDFNYGMSVMIMARNSRYDMVVSTQIENHDFQPRPIVPYLYFPSETVIQMSVHRQIHMPMMKMHPLDVGEPMGNPNFGDVEMMIYEANVQKDDEPQELIVMPEDVPELMAKIRKAQEPRAREILANEQKRGDMNELQMKAKILTFSKAG